MMIYTKGRMVVNLMDDILPILLDDIFSLHSSTVKDVIQFYFSLHSSAVKDFIQFYALPTMKKRDIAAPLVSSYGKYSIDIPDVVQ